MLAGIGLSVGKILGGVEALASSIELAAGLEAVVAVQAIETVAAVGTIVDTAAVSVKAVSSVKNAHDLSKTDTNINYSSDTQNRSIFYNNRGIQDDEWTEVMNERVVKVERMSSSKWKYFPSGVLTPFTWVLFGQALRHEFVFIHTEKHLCLVELIKTEEQGSNVAASYQLRMEIFSCYTEQIKNNQRNELLRKRFCDRQLKEKKIKNKLFFNQINGFINLVLKVWENFKDKWHLMEKYDKQLARSIFYFTDRKADLSVILQSIFGIYSDKPFYMTRFDMVGVEKLTWKIQKMFTQSQQTVQQLKTHIRDLQEVPKMEKAKERNYSDIPLS